MEKTSDDHLDGQDELSRADGRVGLQTRPRLVRLAAEFACLGAALEVAEVELRQAGTCSSMQTADPQRSELSVMSGALFPFRLTSHEQAPTLGPSSLERHRLR